MLLAAQHVGIQIVLEKRDVPKIAAVQLGGLARDPLAVLLYEIIEGLEQLGIVEPYRPGNFVALGQPYVQHPQVGQDLGPQLGHVVVRHSEGEHAGVDHFQQVLGGRAGGHFNDLHPPLGRPPKAPVQRPEMLCEARTPQHVNLAPAQILDRLDGRRAGMADNHLGDVVNVWQRKLHAPLARLGNRQQTRCHVAPALAQHGQELVECHGDVDHRNPDLSPLSMLVVKPLELLHEVVLESARHATGNKKLGLAVMYEHADSALLRAQVRGVLLRRAVDHRLDLGGIYTLVLGHGETGETEARQPCHDNCKPKQHPAAWPARSVGETVFHKRRFYRPDRRPGPSTRKQLSHDIARQHVDGTATPPSRGFVRASPRDAVAGNPPRIRLPVTTRPTESARQARS